MAAVNGIDLDKQDAQSAHDRVEERKRRIEAMQSGATAEEFEFGELGLDIEIEE